MTKWIGVFLMHFHGPAVYVGVLFVLITCGLGVPLPEDAPLIYGGYLIGLHGNLPLMIATGLAGILIGDSIIFRAGATHGMRLLETRLGRHIPGERVESTIALFEKHGPKFIMVARFVPGLRAVTYFVAGAMGVPYWTFLAYDGLAACISAPAWVILGWWAKRHGMLAKVWAWAANAQVAIIIGAVCLIALWITIAVIRRKKRKERLALMARLPKEPPTLRAVEGIGRRG
ncbi:MAG TPA: DedA family protein [Myxococcales bacterium]|jgi:membrane protein DedA with SNARE-associated domain|nr:DedA family protein [Myxococcales bacterium]